MSAAIDEREQHWFAQPRQYEALVTHADIDDIFFGGQAGGGKTDYLTIYQIMRRQKYAGSHGLILRRKFTDLAKSGSNIDRFLELTHDMGVKYDANTHKATWHNGSVTEFGYCDSRADMYNYRGAQYDDASFDEATLLDWEWFVYIAGRVRVRSKKLAALGMRPQIRSTANPGGLGHAYFKKRYVDLGRSVVYTDRDVPPGVPPQTRIFIPSSLSDNPALEQSDPSYRYRLMQLPDAERRAMLDGNWDIFEGQVFTEWHRAIHVVPAFTPPRHWRRWLGFDWGYASPMSAGWYAENPDTREIVRYRELYARRLNDSEQAARIASLSRGEKIDYMAADPSIWSHKGGDATTAATFQAVFAAQGLVIPLVPADNDRLLGLRRCHDILAWEDDGAGNVVSSPLFKVTENCTEFIRTVPLLAHDPIRVEDVDTKLEDHVYDDWRYAMMSRSVTRLDDRQFGTVELIQR